VAVAKLWKPVRPASAAQQPQATGSAKTTKLPKMAQSPCIYSLGLLAWQGALARGLATTRILVLQLITIGRHLAASERVEEVVQRKDRRRLVPFAAMIALGLIVVAACGAWSWGGSARAHLSSAEPPSRAAEISSLGTTTSPGTIE